MSRQAVHEHGVRRRSRDEFLIHLVRRKNLGALASFVFLAHAGPRVGINRVDAFNRLLWIGKYVDHSTSLLGYRLCVSEDLAVRTVTLWRGHADFRSKTCTREQQRMGHIIAVADVGQADILKIAKAFLQCEIVS